MKLLFLIFSFNAVFFGNPLFGQNLIVNPSLEAYQACPESFATTFKREIIPEWTSPNNGTPDYFNSCSSGDAGIPENWTGYSEPVDGKAYLGMYLYKEPNYREFIQGALVAPLVRSQRYILSFYVSRAMYEDFHIDKLGVLLVKDQMEAEIKQNQYAFDPSESTTHKKGKSNTKQIQESSSAIMNIDTAFGQYLSFDLLACERQAEWYLVKLEFDAELAARYFVVGNFVGLEKLEMREAKYDFAKNPMLENSSYVLVDHFILEAHDQPTIAEAIEAPDPIIVNDVNFEFNSAALARHGIDLLDSIAGYLGQNDWNLNICGHTDSLGTNEYNLALSRQRAENVAKYIIAYGVEEGRILVDAKGEEKPITSNSSAASRRMNRRVEITFLSRAKEDY